MSKKQYIIANLLKFKDFLTIRIKIHNYKKMIKFNLIKGKCSFLLEI